MSSFPKYSTHTQTHAHAHSHNADVVQHVVLMVQHRMNYLSIQLATANEVDVTFNQIWFCLFAVSVLANCHPIASSSSSNSW